MVNAAMRMYGGPDCVIVHGDCPTGADAIAKKFCHEWGWTEEPHPANWSKYRKGAGPVRNTEMVEAGPYEVCLAFPLEGGSGSQDCMTKAKNAGIHILNFGDDIEY